MSKTFIDTNILVYALDPSEPKKQNQARAILNDLRHSGVISTQVLQEFYGVATKKLNINPILAKNILHLFENYETVTVNPVLIQDAADCSILHQISFWDALIVASAESACCETILSEDLNDGQIIRGVKVVNPFLQPMQLNEKPE